MKKSYSKPEIIFEDFSLSTNIAGDCDIITGTQSENECGYLYGRDGLMIFMTGITGCKYTEVNNQEVTDGYNGVCYHVPTDKTDLFNS